jgi:hypothetical protein
MSTEIPHIPTDMDAVRSLLHECSVMCEMIGTIHEIVALLALAVSLMPNGKRARAAMIWANARIGNKEYGWVVNEIRLIAEEK